MRHFFLFIAIFICNLILFTYNPFPDQDSQKYNNIIVKPVNITHKVFFAVMTTAKHQYDTVKLKNLLIPRLSKTNFYHSMIFYCESPLKFDKYNETNFPFVPVDPKGDLSHHFLCSKIKESLRHFLFETTASWYIRICGDTYINVNKFPLFLSEINESNPFTDILIQGACLGKLDITYLQGGSGFVFSRKAAFDLYNDHDFFNNTCTIYKNDDKAISKYLKKVNISFHDASSRWFLGHQFIGYKSAYSAIVNATKFNVKRDKCGKKPSSNKGCKAYYSRINEIVFWHDKTPFDNFIGKIDQILNYSTDNLFFYVPNNKPMICVADRNIHTGYYS